MPRCWYIRSSPEAAASIPIQVLPLDKSFRDQVSFSSDLPLFLSRIPLEISKSVNCAVFVLVFFFLQNLFVHARENPGLGTNCDLSSHLRSLHRLFLVQQSNLQNISNNIGKILQILVTKKIKNAKDSDKMHN